ncbi:hypothetical protein MMC13_008282 [Lambiella insularis]|nr:hypothetical protein [Lambiella insularis]
MMKSITNDPGRVECLYGQRLCQWGNAYLHNPGSMKNAAGKWVGLREREVLENVVNKRDLILRTFDKVLTAAAKLQARVNVQIIHYKCVNSHDEYKDSKSMEKVRAELASRAKSPKMRALLVKLLTNVIGANV